ncbi:MAG: cobamide remodeling phosphodiesterase CbiR [Desulfotignum sp.]|nr:cobamide remodeling phosphodiesterase CbiR [Desulfotignum sp.]
MKRQFRLGTTSFIYPDHIIPNVRKTGAFFDEIELLVFESMPEDVLPSPTQIAELACLSRDLNVGYNVHLPTDVSLTSSAAKDRQKAADTIARVVELCAPLSPSTHTLHLEMGFESAPSRAKPGTKPTSNSDELLRRDKKDMSAWQMRAMDGLERLVPLLPAPGVISLETLDYSPALLQPLAQAHGLMICIDAGHHFLFGYDLAHSFAVFRDRLALVHLHGAACLEKGMKDHISLDHLGPHQLLQVRRLLADCEGTVSLEVFNRQDLNRSLAVLSDMFNDIPSHLPA